MIVIAKKDFLDDMRAARGERLDVTDHRGRELIRRGLAEPARPTKASPAAPTGIRTGAAIPPSLLPPAKAPAAKTSKPRAAKRG